MADRPVNVAGIRRLLNVSPKDLSDHEIRRVLARLAADYDAQGTPEQVAESARRVAESLQRPTRLLNDLACELSGVRGPAPSAR